MTKFAYAKSVEVHQDMLSPVEAVNSIVAVVGMTKGSAKYYVNSISKILLGKCYERTLNTEATDYVLTSILDQYDHSFYLDALTSVEKHIEYYEGLGRGSLNSIREVVNRHRDQLENEDERLFPDVIEQDGVMFEGASETVPINIYERNTVARNKCIQHHGAVCCVCNFDFESVYGEIGIGFIHVHHIVPLNKIGESYVVDPIKDLIPVCPNCHAMLHRKNEVMVVDALKKLINTRK